jgi:uncharacterized membrane protein YtjA (UPF0391 family)
MGTARFKSPRTLSPRASRARCFRPVSDDARADHYRSQRGTTDELATFHCNKPESGDSSMGNLLHYAIVFLIVAIIAALFGFGGVAGTAMEGARLLFWVAIVLFVVALVANFLRRA